MGTFRESNNPDREKSSLRDRDRRLISDNQGGVGHRAMQWTINHYNEHPVRTNIIAYSIAGILAYMRRNEIKTFCRFVVRAVDNVLNN